MQRGKNYVIPLLHMGHIRALYRYRAYTNNVLYKFICSRFTLRYHTRCIQYDSPAVRGGICRFYDAVVL